MRSIFSAIALSVIGLSACGGVSLDVPTMHGKTIEESFENARSAQLVHAACSGDAERVSNLVKLGVPVDGRGHRGATPLKWALNCRNLAGMEALLKAGADPNAPGVEELDGYATIEKAVTYRDSSYLKMLLEYGADPNWLDSQGKPLLFWAFAFAHAEKPEYWDNFYTLIGAGADINLASRHGNGLGIAVNAVSDGYASKAIELLEMGYSHDLDSLALFTYGSNMDEDQEQYRNLGILARMLRERGVDTEKAKANVLENDREVGVRPHSFAFETM